MDEDKQLRPRLTPREIQFLIDSLEHTLKMCEIREREFKQLESNVYRLRREVHKGNTMVWRELKEAKEELKSCGNFEIALINYRGVCRSLKRRFEAMLKGGKLHSGWATTHYLNQIYLEPKTL